MATKLTDMGKHLGATAIEQLVLSGILIKQAPKPPPRDKADREISCWPWSLPTTSAINESQKVDLNGVYNDDPTSED